MTLNIDAPSYIPPKIKLKETFSLFFGNISAIKIAYFIPTRFFKAAGTLQFDEIEWKYQLANGFVEGYSILIAISHEYKVCLKALYDAHNGYFYGAVVPMCHMDQKDRDIYLSYRLKQIYNPSNTKWISPCSYGKNLSHLFIMRRKQGKCSFKPLPQKFMILRKYFNITFQWNLVLIRTNKAFVLLKMLRNRIKQTQSKNKNGVES